MSGKSGAHDCPIRRGPQAGGPAGANDNRHHPKRTKAQRLRHRSEQLLAALDREMQQARTATASITGAHAAYGTLDLDACQDLAALLETLCTRVQAGLELELQIIRERRFGRAARRE